MIKKKSDKNKEAWTTLNEFISGLDYVQMAIQRLIGFGKKKSLRKFWQFMKAEP